MLSLIYKCVSIMIVTILTYIKIGGKCKEYSRIDFCSEKPSKSLQNTLFYALVSIICGGKPLKTTNKLAGPVGKKGVLGGVYRLRNV